MLRHSQKSTIHAFARLLGHHRCFRYRMNYSAINRVLSGSQALDKLGDSGDS